MELQLDAVSGIIRRLVDTGKSDWDRFETSFNHSDPTLLPSQTMLVADSVHQSLDKCGSMVSEAMALGEENNRFFIDAYGLRDKLAPDVPIEQITLMVNPAYRYGSKLSEEGQWTRFRQDKTEELISYAISCTMGRYCLDEPGLIYAHSGNEGFHCPGQPAAQGEREVQEANSKNCATTPINASAWALTVA